MYQLKIQLQSFASFHSYKSYCIVLTSHYLFHCFLAQSIWKQNNHLPVLSQICQLDVQGQGSAQTD